MIEKYTTILKTIQANRSAVGIHRLGGKDAGRGWCNVPTEEFAEILKIHPSNANLLIRQMEKSGLILIGSCAKSGDRVLKATEKGKNYLNKDFQNKIKKQ